jgi:DNA-binding transcriptional LysR family regulator
MMNQPLGVERFFSALRCLFVNEIIASERTLSEDGLMMTRPPFDLQQLRCLVVLSETLHFGHAAVRLNMTQPPLSRQIALLEESMGVRLFQRDRRTVTLTSAGRYFVEEARAILQRAEDAAVQTRLAAEGEQGTLTIGFTQAASYELLPQLIGLHHARFPAVSYVFKELLIDEQLRLLEAGSLDVGMVRPPLDHERLDSLIIMRDWFTVALPAGDPLARLEEVPIQALHQRNYIAWSPIAKYFYLILDRLFQDAGVRPRTVVSMAQPPGMLAMVRAGLGLAVVPAAMGSLAFSGIVLRPLVAPGMDPAVLKLEYLLAWRRENREATVQRLIETAGELTVRS